MPFSHHSHSGQFCHHGKDQLEDVIKQAISKKMSVYCMTEHMPREKRDYYPEEQGVDLFSIFEAFTIEAKKLQKKWKTEINLFVGMEIDWIRPSSEQFIKTLLTQHSLDFFIGSVHHVHEIPIDYSVELFQEAKAKSGSLERLYEDYFDGQYDMIQALKPPLVGHFDLIRLKSDAPNATFRDSRAVWDKIIRNLHAINSYGGILELNSAALRKGLEEPYPKLEICKEFAALGGRFTLSDDAHSVEHVGSNYLDTIRFAKTIPLEEIAFLAETGRLHFSENMQYLPLAELQQHPFFRAA